MMIFVSDMPFFESNAISCGQSRSFLSFFRAISSFVSGTKGWSLLVKKPKRSIRPWAAWRQADHPLGRRTPRVNRRGGQIRSRGWRPARSRRAGHLSRVAPERRQGQGTRPGRSQGCPRRTGRSCSPHGWGKPGLGLYFVCISRSQLDRICSRAIPVSTTPSARTRDATSETGVGQILQAAVPRQGPMPILARRLAQALLPGSRIRYSVVKESLSRRL